MKLIHLAAVAALTLPGFAHATDGGNLGAGGMTCAKYNSFKSLLMDKPSVTLVTSWSQGFMTAVNVTRVNANKPVLRYADGEQIEGFTKKYCAEHPLKNVLDATEAIVGELLKDQ